MERVPCSRPLVVLYHPPKKAHPLGLQVQVGFLVISGVYLVSQFPEHLLFFPPSTFWFLGTSLLGQPASRPRVSPLGPNPQVTSFQAFQILSCQPLLCLLDLWSTLFIPILLQLLYAAFIYIIYISIYISKIVGPQECKEYKLSSLIFHRTPVHSTWQMLSDQLVNV